MNRSKLSLKTMMLVSGIGLAAAALGGSQPAAAQSYSDDYSCPAGYIYDPSYGCTLSGYAYEPYDYGYYGYSPYYGGYGAYYGGRHRTSGTASPMAWVAGSRMTSVAASITAQAQPWRRLRAWRGRRASLKQPAARSVARPSLSAWRGERVSLAFAGLPSARAVAI
jgi:hypothetical protein